MSERRRNLFVLLLVLGLIFGSVAVVATKETKLGLDLQGGVSLVYEAKPSRPGQVLDQEAIARAVDIIRERVDALGVAEPEISQVGQRLIEVSLPAVKNAQDAADQVGTTAQMYFYDWEPVILDEDCRTNAEEINGGQTAIFGFINAVKRAAKCPADSDGDNSNASAARVYAFDKAGRALNNQRPEASEKDIFEPGTKRPDGTENTGAKKEGDQVFKVPEGVLIVRQERNDPKAPKPDAWWIINDDPVLGGQEIRNPEQNFDQQTNEPIVTMEFTDKGKKAFAETTRNIAERGSDNAVPGANAFQASHHFAIVLDNELVSTPFINYDENPEGIDGNTGAQISGGFTIESAQDLAKFLKIGALPIDLELTSRSQVSATLGKQALDQGLLAGLVGFGIVALFLLTFYRVLGFIAVSALAVYALYFYALVKLIPVVLTLPGVAGLILTLGVAADANIVVFERIKEEIRAGRSIAAGIAQGYKKGFATIIDANVVTLLVAFILFILATAGVKGFAFMLGLGTIVSLFTAVLATQAILLSLRNTRMLQSKSFLGAGDKPPRWRIDFMGASRYFFAASGIILLIGALGIAAKGLDLGIDFESGTRIKASFQNPTTVDSVRDALDGAGFGDAEIQSVEDPDVPNLIQIASGELRPDDIGRVEEALAEPSVGGGLRTSDDETIGPTFGSTIANSALYAVIASLIVISAYMALRFQAKFAVPVLIALMHDILITAGIYALVGREVTASTVAALLTILGFSLYDTIIVFDRIRENMPRMPFATFSQIVNRSMSEVLTRSLATSFCTGLPVFGILLFGGETLKDFAFALLIGTLSGTYSSVFIAGPLLTHWKEREPVYRTRRARIEAELGHVPAFATAVGGQPVDVAPTEGRRGRSITAPTDPSQGVSQEEFDEMVAQLGVENAPPAGVAPPRTRPAGGRRGKGNGAGTPTPPTPPVTPPAGGAADPGAESTGERPAERPTGGRRTRKKHGRPN
jgi:SecD/SecF fusion protein